MYKVLVALVGVFSPAIAVSAQTTCTGLCLQQKADCPSGTTTSISGTVFAPNGTDPLPNVTVYVPNAPVDPFPDGVSCPASGAPPSGSPLVGGFTAKDGTFTLANAPVGANIPLVIVSGKWRRQVTVPGTAACADTRFNVNMPKNRTEGDIPKIAVATGSQDQVECVLRKMGIEETEFTDPAGGGRINLYSGSGSAGARISTSSPTENTLMSNTAALHAYDVLMLPCQGSAFTKSSAQLANLMAYANAGGRVYSSHFSYVWMNTNGPFSGVVNWRVNQPQLPNGTATVNTSFPEGEILADWLQRVGATSTLGQMEISTLRHDFDGVVPPTKSWLELNNAANGNPVMQFTFDTPLAAANQCGRVLFNEYHVENPPTGTSPTNRIFPAECPAASVPMTPQEKLLEYSLFSLTSGGREPTLTPDTMDFGTQSIGFATAPKTFTWTNHSSFAASVTSASTSGDFAVSSNNCTAVPSEGSCQINVVFTPTAIGARTGVLTVASPGKSITASLTGTGVPGFSVSPNALNFGSVDVGGSATLSINVTNNAPGALAVPAMVVTGDYSAASGCGVSLPSLATCTVNITFRPTATGTRSGTWTFSGAVYSSLIVSLTGTGIDFSIGLNPTSGHVIAGNGINSTATLTPISGFARAVALTCTTTAPAATCTVSSGSVVPSAVATVTMTTGSKYTVIGYGGLGGRGFALLLSLLSGAAICWQRRRAGSLVRLGVMVGAIGLIAISGCAGKYPSQNATYTPPGSYQYTVSATDGTITHTADFTLAVTAR